MCLSGCTSDSGKETAKTGEKAGSGTTAPGTGTTNGGTIATCKPFKIKSETVATTPGVRTRTKIGIGEEVNLTTDPSTSVKWTIVSDDTHKGTLGTASGVKSKYTACDRSKTVKIEAKSACGRTETITFTVVQPSGSQFGAETDISAITATHIAVGFTAPPAALPNDVSFYNCEMREGTCMSTSSGVLAVSPEIQHADTGSWIGFSKTVGTNGTELGVSDTVRSRRPLTTFPAGGTTNGRFSWPIPWRAQVRNGGTNGAIVFGTMNHVPSYTAASRVYSMTKGNRSKQRVVP